VLGRGDPDLALEQLHLLPAGERALVERAVAQRQIEVPRALRLAEGQPRPAAHLDLLDRQVLVDRETVLGRDPKGPEGGALGDEEQEVDVFRVAGLAPEASREAAVEKIVELTGVDGVEGG